MSSCSALAAHRIIARAHSSPCRTVRSAKTLSARASAGCASSRRFSAVASARTPRMCSIRISGVEQVAEVQLEQDRHPLGLEHRRLLEPRLEGGAARLRQPVELLVRAAGLHDLPARREAARDELRQHRVDPALRRRPEEAAVRLRGPLQVVARELAPGEEAEQRRVGGRDLHAHGLGMTIEDEAARA